MNDHVVTVGSEGQMFLLNIKKEKPIKVYKSADSGSMSSVINNNLSCNEYIYYEWFFFHTHIGHIHETRRGSVCKQSWSSHATFQRNDRLAWIEESTKTWIFIDFRTKLVKKQGKSCSGSFFSCLEFCTLHICVILICSVVVQEKHRSNYCLSMCTLLPGSNGNEK